MKNWKEVPHLFANGMFKVQVSTILGLKDEVFFGIHPRNHTIDLGTFYESKGVDDCTLIARRIEDMTDEEVRNLSFYKLYSGGIGSFRKTHLPHTAGYTEDLMYLLSRGVYPFEWPDDGSVTDPKTLNNNEL